MIDIKRLTYDDIETNETSMKYLLKICLIENIPDIGDSEVQKLMRTAEEGNISIY